MIKKARIAGVDPETGKYDTEGSAEGETTFDK
jgi:hypothetical protein